MHPFSQEHRPAPSWNRPTYPHPPLDKSLQRSPSPFHAQPPDLFRSSNVPPPPPMPVPIFAPPSMDDRPFIPIDQRRDIFFENPKPRAYTSSSQPYAQRQHSPAPPVPPLPPNLHRHDTQPTPTAFSRTTVVTHNIVRTSSAPPVPPKPTTVAPPALPPKVPVQPPLLDFNQALPIRAPSRSVSPVPPNLDHPPSLKPGARSYATTSTFQSPTPVPGPSTLDVLPPKSAQPVIVQEEPPLPRYSERVPTPDEESAALARALAISASESDAQQRLRSQEDEDFARALQASMEATESELAYVNDYLPESFPDNAEDERLADHTLATSPLSSPLQDFVPNADRLSTSTSAADISNDERYARTLMMGMDDHEEDTRSSAPAADLNSVPNDELFARSLIVEDVEDPSQDEFGSAPDTALPSYSEAVLSSEAELAELAENSPFQITSIATDISPPREPTPEPNPLLLISIASYQPISPVTESSIPSRSPSLIASIPVTPEPELRNLDQLHPDTIPQNLRPSSHSPVSRSSSSSSLVSHEQERNDRSPEIPVNPNPLLYLDPEFLLGVSIGFMNPTITAELTPMKGVMPNIIALPYGRCPPLHIQAPSWRHMLRLMARLSNTRVEPTVEALATTKATLQLRTVVQFVKAPDESWRTVLWLTIDHPVPQGVTSWKWTNGDVNTLPWSYTLLAQLPHLLRDGCADSTNSKFYAIPSTSSTPWPTLPISFPNYVIYLQRVLENSRRAMHDSSRGTRRLAKMIDQFYPEAPQRNNDDDLPERIGGVSGLFKRVMGRGNKNKKGVNEDTYDLVTPFMPDEW